VDTQLDNHFSSRYWIVRIAGASPGRAASWRPGVPSTNTMKPFVKTCSRLWKTRGSPR